MKRYQLIRWTWLALALGLQACVEPFDASYQLRADLLTIDGVLSDVPEPQFVRFQRSVPTARGINLQPWQGAQADVVVDGNQTLTLRESQPGRYFLPDGFRAQPGHTYQLRFRNPDGTRYESTVETMPRSKPITRVYDEFDAEAIRRQDPNGKPLILPGHQIRLDSQDPAGTRDYYNWKWKSWEAIDICVTCINAMYRGSACVNSQFLWSEFDYICERKCWDIFSGNTINLFSDGFSDGGAIQGQPVAAVPYYASSGALVEIEQQALTLEAFRYYKLLAEQGQNTGSLVDTPPASIFGNVSQVGNPSQRLVGFFTVAGISRTRYWLSRRNVPATAPPPLGFLGGRLPNYEPPSAFPPVAPCLPGDTRTPVKPEGWQD